MGLFAVGESARGRTAGVKLMLGKGREEEDESHARAAALSGTVALATRDGGICARSSRTLARPHHLSLRPPCEAVPALEVVPAESTLLRRREEEDLHENKDDGRRAHKNIYV